MSVLVYAALLGLASGRPLMYINSQGDGSKEDNIFVYQLNPATGRSVLIDTVPAGPNPSWMTFNADSSLLITTNEVEEWEGQPTGAVQSFEVAPDGKLTFINRVPSGGGSPCHVEVDADSKGVVVANYGAGTVAALPLNLGRLAPPASVRQHAGRADQTPHAHMTHLAGQQGRSVLAVDLGLDRVFHYQLTAENQLVPAATPWVSLPDGAGPRHIVVHPRMAFAYVINELGSSVAVFQYDRASGQLGQRLQLISTLAPGFNSDGNYPGEVVVSPDGRHLYGSNRGNNSIAHFNIDQVSGQLSFVDTTPCDNWPRFFTLVPGGRFMLVAGQRSNTVGTLQVDPTSGRLSPSSVPDLAVQGPQCITFLL